MITHTARAHVPTPDLGAAHEDVSFTTSDGLRLEGWFVPSRNGATVIVVPGRSGPQKRPGCSFATATACCSSTVAGKARATAIRTSSAGEAKRDLHAAAAYLQSRPDVDPERIGAIGLSVGGEMLIHAAAHSDAFAAVVSEGASGQSVRDELANPDLSERILDLPTQVSLTLSWRASRASSPRRV